MALAPVLFAHVSATEPTLHDVEVDREGVVVAGRLCSGPDNCLMNTGALRQPAALPHYPGWFPVIRSMEAACPKASIAACHAG